MILDTHDNLRVEARFRQKIFFGSIMFYQILRFDYINEVLHTGDKRYIAWKWKKITGKPLD